MEIAILRGCAGSGKTSWVGAPPGATRISADDYWLTLDGTYHFDPIRIGKAHAHCLRRYVYMIEQAIAPLDGGPEYLIVDNTNCSLIEVAPYIAVGLAFEHNVRVFDFGGLVSAETCAARNRHAVPLDAVLRQYAAMQKANTDWPKFWPQREIGSLT